MLADVLSYALLMGVLIVMSLRLLVKKPNVFTEPQLRHGRPTEPAKQQELSR